MSFQFVTKNVTNTQKSKSIYVYRWSGKSFRLMHKASAWASLFLITYYIKDTIDRFVWVLCLKTWSALEFFLTKKWLPLCESKINANESFIHFPVNNSTLCTFVCTLWAKQNHKKGGDSERLLAGGKARWPHSRVTKTLLCHGCEAMKQGIPLSLTSTTGDSWWRLSKTNSFAHIKKVRGL